VHIPFVPEADLDAAAVASLAAGLVGGHGAP
jgi:hypothetical protein